MNSRWNGTRIAIKTVAWVLFVAVAVWGVVPLVGGRTLTDILMSESGVSFRTAAAVVSILVALLGTLAIAMPRLPPSGGGAKEDAITHRGQSKSEASPGTPGAPRFALRPRRRAAWGEGGLHADRIPHTSHFVGDAALP